MNLCYLSKEWANEAKKSKTTKNNPLLSFQIIIRFSWMFVDFKLKNWNHSRTLEFIHWQHYIETRSLYSVSNSFDVSCRHMVKMQCVHRSNNQIIMMWQRTQTWSVLSLLGFSHFLFFFINANGVWLFNV